MEHILLVDHQYLCESIAQRDVGGILECLERIEEFPFSFLFCESKTQEIYDLLFQNRKNDDIIAVSRWINHYFREPGVRWLSDTEWKQRKKEFHDIFENESEDFRAVIGLYAGHFFDSRRGELCLQSDSALRCISSEYEFKQAMSLFGLEIDSLEVFGRYIQKLYDRIVFDKNIVVSMKQMEDPFSVRKNEILEHLYFIDHDVPKILEGSDTSLSNDQIGKAMAIDCSPERNRTTVKNHLTASDDNGESFVCELHTKMRKIGKNHKPDRIYFSAKVPKGIVVDGKNIEGCVYVFKISRHV